MKYSLIKLLVALLFLASSSLSVAGSNNGYTSAANVYTGSSSRTWYGGGVAFVLSEWKKEKEVSVEKVERVIEEQQSTESKSD
ncbi:hypothetical protein OO007_00435 [Cocleimonas sp. KMM 6892]|jgi:hypothetical protein|uniref:hypothetical protein n=1 Tax=unclassified Cocleimonas TaxID=2639732 RepID=UPI002DBEDC64|nr:MULTISPECIES: hypothetical protein [unclassified Cocleimonas]MEB8430679.1 hypothetical protein [Cocleimonas sp. KMM 6892]MEC4714549.1 hypothetical protein [Cocleimonas sp. KMM 6895]MEC4743882.1 hypothetical protein [Cocleimonas sp. KMM 6896]